MYLAMASTVEAQTAEEAKRLSKTELCGRKPVIDLQMRASRNLIYFAVNRNINQFQRLMRGHGAAKMRHTYTLVCTGVAQPCLFAEGMLRQITYKYTYLYEYSSLYRSEYPALLLCEELSNYVYMYMYMCVCCVYMCVFVFVHVCACTCACVYMVLCAKLFDNGTEWRKTDSSNTCILYTSTQCMQAT